MEYKCKWSAGYNYDFFPGEQEYFIQFKCHNESGRTLAINEYSPTLLKLLKIKIKRKIHSSIVNTKFCYQKDL